MKKILYIQLTVLIILLLIWWVHFDHSKIISHSLTQCKTNTRQGLNIHILIPNPTFYILANILIPIPLCIQMPPKCFLWGISQPRLYLLLFSTALSLITFMPIQSSKSRTQETWTWNLSVKPHPWMQ
jgi:hypothetical protein